VSSNCTVCRSGESKWIKSAASSGGDACVELSSHGDSIALRNSRQPATILHFTKDEIRAFVSGARGGEFDALVS
jgi:hypothetical protein